MQPYTRHWKADQISMKDSSLLPLFHKRSSPARYRVNLHIKRDLLECDTGTRGTDRVLPTRANGRCKFTYFLITLAMPRGILTPPWSEFSACVQFGSLTDWTLLSGVFVLLSWGRWLGGLVPWFLEPHGGEGGPPLTWECGTSVAFKSLV